MLDVTNTSAGSNLVGNSILLVSDGKNARWERGIRSIDDDINGVDMFDELYQIILRLFRCSSIAIFFFAERTASNASLANRREQNCQGKK